MHGAYAASSAGTFVRRCFTSAGERKPLVSQMSGEEERRSVGTVGCARSEEEE